MTFYLQIIKLLELYHRHPYTLLFFLRFLFIVLVILLAGLAIDGNDTYIYLVGFSMLAAALFPVSSFIAEPQYVLLRQFYFFGIFCKKLEINRGDYVELNEINITMSDPDHPIDDGDLGEALVQLMPSNSRSFNKQWVRKYYPDGSYEDIKLNLSDDEIQLLKMIANVQLRAPESTI